MTPDEFRSELSRLGLSGVRAAKALRVNEKTVRRWVSGEVPIPFAVGEYLKKLTPREAKELLRQADADTADR